MNNRSDRVGMLRRTAKEVRNYKSRMKLLSTALILLAILLAVIYVSAALYKREGSFTISLDKMEMTKYGLTLSETADMRYNTSHLNAQINEEMTNIAAESIPADVDIAADGVHNGKDYIAYTFYLQNAGEVEISYEYAVNISNITNDLDDAIRIRVYHNGEETTYAKAAAAGGAEAGTEAFYSSTVALRERVDAFAPEEIHRFTVVVWIEGNDPECLDWLIGGQLKLDMKIEIIH